MQQAVRRVHWQTVEIGEWDETSKTPEIGEPSRTAMPWNRTVSPNAFVSFWMPRISTNTIDRRVMNVAVTRRHISHTVHANSSQNIRFTMQKLLYVYLTTSEMFRDVHSEPKNVTLNSCPYLHTIMIILLQIFCPVCQWKNFENRSISGEDMNKSFMPCLLTRCATKKSHIANISSLCCKTPALQKSVQKNFAEYLWSRNLLVGEG